MDGTFFLLFSCSCCLRPFFLLGAFMFGAGYTRFQELTSPLSVPTNILRARHRNGHTQQPEEEAYSTAVIRHFRAGLLRLPDGLTLRGYLAEKLNCDPMRITKKYAGAACLGKRTFSFQDR